MYELNGNPLSLEDLKEGAEIYGMEFEEYLNVMKTKGLVEKTEGVAGNDATVAPTADMGLASENIFSELPEVSKKDVGLSEKEFVSKFNKTYDGLGFTAIEATYEDVQTIALALTPRALEIFKLFFQEKILTIKALEIMLQYCLLLTKTALDKERR